MIKKISNTYSLGLGALITISLTLYLVYYLLLSDNILHTSISSIVYQSNKLEMKVHMMVLGLLPIYIAAMIFGSGLLSAYIGSRLEHLVIRKVKHRF